MNRKIPILAIALVAAAFVGSCGVPGGNDRPQGAYWECDSQPNVVTTHPCDHPGREPQGKNHGGTQFPAPAG